MNAITRLESLGYSFHLGGDRLRYTHTGVSPDPALVRPLLAELKQRKNEAFRFLQADLTLFFDGANGGYGLVEGTSNAAEYTALIEGLKAANHLAVLSLMVKGDSQLVINQMSGLWQIKNEGLRPLHQQASDLITGLTNRGVSIDFQWIPREQNKQADKLSRKALTDAPESNHDFSSLTSWVYPEVVKLFLQSPPEAWPILLFADDGTQEVWFNSPAELEAATAETSQRR